VSVAPITTPPAPEPADPSGLDSDPPSTTTVPAPSTTTGQRPSDARGRPSLPARAAMGFLLTLVAVAVTVILLAPVLLSSHDLLAWGGAPTGVGLPGRWPYLVILTLDAPAIACVLMSVICTWRGERSGLFAALVWLFAAVSAFANYRHTHTGTAPDAAWFIPAASLIGPGLLAVVLHRIRAWTRSDRTNPGGPRAGDRPRSWSWQRWVPGIGSLRDTFGAHRTRILLNLGSFTDAVEAFHDLCPDGSLRVAAALRRRHLAQSHARILTALAGEPAAHTGDDLPAGDTDGPDTTWPVDLLRRIPVGPAYQRWHTAWNDLRTSQTHSDSDLDTGHDGDRASSQNLSALAEKYGISTRQMQFLLSAGRLHLLDSPIPTAVRLAKIAHEQTQQTVSTSPS
jgi:hypothetical protein